MGKSLTDIEAAVLEEVSKLAGLFFTPREIAVMLELDVTDFVFACDQTGCQVFNAFHAGRLQSEVDLRSGILKLAKSGSSPAQTMALDLLNKSKLKMFDR